MSLREIQICELNILLYFKKYCKDLGIKYYLSNGTLLGAIKYQGFIPWDDDIDVFVPRQDYEKLIKSFADNDRFALLSYERNRNFLYPFAKLCDKGTLIVDNKINTGIKLGVNIDIFPLDAWPSEKKEAYKRAKKMNILCSACILSKAENTKGKEIYKRIVYSICRIIGSQYFVKKLIQRAEWTGDQSFFGCVVWPVYGVKEVIPTDVFSSTVDVMFEGNKFSAPIGYESYLYSLYGNYKVDPPLDKQITHHTFDAFKI